jgi:hypothetical protein
MQEAMRKLISFVVLAVLLSLTCPAGAECWGWDNKGSRGAPVCEINCSPAFFAFDEKSQKLSLTIDRWEGRTVELWTYDGNAWEMVWISTPETPPGWLGYVESLGLYYDQNLEALVLVSHLFVAPEVFCDALYKFVPGAGWRLIVPCLDVWGVGNVVFDTIRKRAIFTGGFKDPSGRNPSTLEYDGNRFYSILNPPDLTFDHGVLGFNPETGKTVYFGSAKEGKEIETYEYDGSTWVKIVTEQTPPFRADAWNYDNNGIPYVPDLYGIIFIPGSSDKSEIWLYKNGQWIKMDFIVEPPGRLDGILEYDHNMKRVVFWASDASVEGGNEYSGDVWAFGRHNHCRPLSKP